MRLINPGALHRANPRTVAILDLTGVESLPDPSQLRSVGPEIDRVRDRVTFGRCAIVAGSDAMFGLMRMFEVFAADRFAMIRVFRQPVDAARWLRSATTE